MFTFNLLACFKLGYIIDAHAPKTETSFIHFTKSPKRYNAFKLCFRIQGDYKNLNLKLFCGNCSTSLQPYMLQKAELPLF